MRDERIARRVQDRLIAGLEPAPPRPRSGLDARRLSEHGTDGFACLRDIWLDDRRVAVVAAVLRPTCQSGIVLAATFDPLVRTALRLSTSPASAVELLLEAIDGSGLRARRIDMAVAVLDLTSGAYDAHAIGRAQILSLSAGLLGEGERLWLATEPPAGPLPLIGDWPDGATLQAARPLRDGAFVVAGLAIERRDPANRMGILLRDLPDENTAILSQVDRFLDQHGAYPEFRQMLQLALNECLTLVVPAVRRLCDAREVILELAVSGRQLELILSDDGQPFDPTTLPLPELNGPIDPAADRWLGLQLLELLADRLDYRRDNGWNRLRFARNLASTTKLGGPAGPPS